jgi:hypothetical protein
LKKENLKGRHSLGKRDGSKRRGISLPAEQLTVSQERLCSM